jgi:hypothetical protein
MNEWNRSNDPRYHPGYPQDPRSGRGHKSKWLAGLLAFLVPGTGHFYLGLMIRGVAIMLLIAVDICAIVYAAQQLNNVLFIVLLSLLLPIVYFYNLFDAIQSTDMVNDRLVHPGWYAPPYGAPAVHIPAAPNFAEQPPEAVEQGPDPFAPPTPPHAGQVPGGRPLFPQEQRQSTNSMGLILLAAGAVVLLLASDFSWTRWIFQSSGSFAGAVILIVAGAAVWFWENRGHNERKS